MAVLSSKVRHVADYFRQKFAQVTNPAIDPLRESVSCLWRPAWGPSRTFEKRRGTRTGLS